MIAMHRCNHFLARWKHVSEAVDGVRSPRGCLRRFVVGNLRKVLCELLVLSAQLTSSMYVSVTGILPLGMVTMRQTRKAELWSCSEDELASYRYVQRWHPFATDCLKAPISVWNLYSSLMCSSCVPCDEEGPPRITELLVAERHMAQNSPSLKAKFRSSFAFYINEALIRRSIGLVQLACSIAQHKKEPTLE